MQIQFSKIARLHGYLSRWAWFGTLETTALLFAMAFVDYAHWLPFRLTQLQPHPFWIPVVLAASCYGRPAGYFVAICATVLDWSQFADHPDFYDFLVASSKNAILWLAAAAVLGRFRERQVERRREAEEARDQRTEEARILADRCRALARETADLERRIASSGASGAGSVLEVFQKVLRLPGALTIDGYKQALYLLIGARQIRVYVPDGPDWVALPGSEEIAIKAVPGVVCNAVASSANVLSCLRPADAELLNGYGAMAACVRGKDGRSVGVVFIGEVDPACITSAGEAAISLGSFILGSRYLETELPVLEDSRAQQPKVQLKVVNGEGARGQSQS